MRRSTGGGISSDGGCGWVNKLRCRYNTANIIDNTPNIGIAGVCFIRILVTYLRQFRNQHKHKQIRERLSLSKYFHILTP